MMGFSSPWYQALSALMSVLALAACSTKEMAFDVRFGKVGIVFEGSQPHQMMIEETTIVPRDVGGETALGFEIRPSSNEPYETYSVHHLPKPPTSVGSTGALSLTDDGAIRTDAEKVVGRRVFSFGFDEGDPLGTYTIDVYVNGRLVKSASIEVVESGAD